MTEAELAFRPYKNPDEDYDLRVLRRLDQLGRGRGDYVFVRIKYKSEAPDISESHWYNEMCGLITVLCDDHEKNTLSSFYYGVEFYKGKVRELMIHRDHIKILKRDAS